ncbi:MAG: radical SAM protein [Anaerolineales bacterium]|jgi:predicted DNA-binding helix-hairpin-helix protein|nr:radical SAM protein [Anaerolineales bacterium]
MDALTRLKMLSSQMTFEPDLENRPACFSKKQEEQIFVHPAHLPNGGRIQLLKTLLSSTCERDCFYCPFRAGRDFRRATFQPEEFARLFMGLQRAGLAEGVFLSSGIAAGGPRTQDKLLETAEILRKKLDFRGYLHLKLMPGTQRAQVERAMLLADRISVNLEAPNSERLARLAPHKIFIEELLQPLQWADEIRRTENPRRAWKGRWPSSTTQFVAGGADESDLELLTTTAWLTKNVGLKRAYFSAFHPIRDTPFENKAAVDPLREQRLYQASFLLRDYGFDLEELPFTDAGGLPLADDPKLACARLSLVHTPLELNRAEKRDLLRVPGIGPKAVEVLLKARRTAKLKDLSHLRALGINTVRAAPFILLDGKRPAQQMALF